MNDAAWSLSLPAPADTERLGRCLAACRPSRAIVFLKGDLGAGKTTLARALLRGLGVQGPVRSPTYTLVERYPLAAGEAVHMDLYRLADPGELDFLGLDDLHAEAALWLVEWPERGEGALPDCDLIVELGVAGEGRRARLRPCSPAGAEWVGTVKPQFS
mgnify:CR=1 FL=1